MNVTDPPPSKIGLPGFAAALAIFLALGAFLLWPALGPGDQVLSPAGFWTRLGPFPTELSSATPPDITVMSDSVQQFVPWLRYAADGWLRDGRIPLWKDTALCGAPFVGNGQSAVFFPPVLLSIVLGAPLRAHALLALIKLAGGALCAWMLARHLRLSFLASLLCGVTFGFGGFQVVWLLYPHTNVSMLLPLLLLAADRAVLAPSLRSAGLLALVAGLQHLGGHPETAFHCQTLAVACAVARTLALRRCATPWAPWRRLGALLGGLVLGACVGAVQTLPVLEYMSQSQALHQRREVMDFPGAHEPLWGAAFAAAVLVAVLAFRWLARPGRWAPVAAVLLLGATGAALATGLQAGVSLACMQVLAADWFGSARHYLGPVNYITDNGGFAGAALALAVVGMFAARQRGLVTFLAVLLGLGLLMGYHAPWTTDLLHVLPVFSVAANQRLVLVSLLATALLAGFGLDALGRSARGAGERELDALKQHAPGSVSPGQLARGSRSRLRLALALVVPVIAVVGALELCVDNGWIGARNVPPGPDGSGVRATLLSAGAGAQLEQYFPELSRCAERMLPPDQGRLFCGFFATPEPLSGARLVYGRNAASAYAQTVPMTEVPVLQRTLPELKTRIGYAFRAMVPRDELLPEPTSVRLWVRLLSGRVELTELLAVPAEGEPSWLPYPVRPVPGPADVQLLALGGAALLAVLALHARGRWLLAARLALVVLAGCGMARFTAGMLPMLPARLFYPVSLPIQVMRKLAPDARQLNLHRHKFGAEIPTYYGIPDVDGYDALSPLHTATLLDAAVADFEARSTPPAEAVPPANAAQPGDAAPPAQPAPSAATSTGLELLGLMSVKALTDFEGEPGPMEVQHYRVDRDPCNDPYAIAINPRFLPRARLVSGSVVEGDDDRALELLRDPGFPRERCVVLAEGESRAPAGAEPGSATIATSHPEQVRVEIAPAAPGWLVLSDTFFPGWKALVDGEERPIVRANVAFRAVAVQPGDRLVEFRYEPFWYRAGAVLSLVAGLAALGACFVRPAASRSRLLGSAGGC